MARKDSGTSETVLLGTADDNVVGRVMLQVVGSGWTGGLTPMGRVDPAAPLVNLPYRNHGTNTPVAAGTAITADGLYDVDAPGMEVVLVHARTAGSVQIYPRPLRG